MTPEMVLEFIKTNRIEYADLRFLDFPGLWQHLTVPAREVTLDSFKDGFGFDGSSIRGWQAINESDMLIVPVAETMILDPFFQHPTISMICDVKNPLTRAEYSRDPRSVARKAAAYMKNTGIADTAYFGPELEFFIFDKAIYDQGMNSPSTRSIRAGRVAARAREPDNLGNQLRAKRVTSPCRRPIRCTICAARWWPCLSSAEFTSRRTITRSPPAAGRDRHALRPAGAWATRS